MKERIDFGNMTSEEIRLKQMELSNHYESLTKISIDILEELDLLEEEYDNATRELNKRGI